MYLEEKFLFKITDKIILNKVLSLVEIMNNMGEKIMKKQINKEIGTKIDQVKYEK